MKKVIVILLILTIVLSGCIRIKQPCPQDQLEQQVTQNKGNAITGAVTAVPDEPQKTELEPKKEIPRVTEEVKNVKRVIAGELVSFPNLNAKDPEGQTLSYTFTEPLNNKGEWQTTKDDIGEYLVEITLSDGQNKVTEKVKIVVEKGNVAPIIEAPEIMSVDEGDLLRIPISVEDPDGDEVAITYSGWVTELPYQVTFSDAGVHVIKVSATDGSKLATKEIEVRVRNINKPPEITPIADITINETDKITVMAKATDHDGDPITFRYSPPLDNRGTWNTAVGDEGRHEVTVTASDGKSETTESFYIIVGSKNKAPIIKGVKDLEVNEGDTITLDITAEDPEGEDVSLIFSGYMQTRTHTASYDDAGTHTVRVEAYDGQRSTQESFTITVKDVNRPPVFTSDAFS